MVEIKMEELHCCDFLVMLFCGTQGSSCPVLLGSDEADIVILVWQLLDLAKNQTGDIHYIFVKPESKVEVSDEWIKSTGITQQLLESAIPFVEAIKQLEQAIRNELNSQGRTCKFSLCTDGQCHLRQVLHPAAVRNNITLPDFFHSFFDLQKEFLRCCPGAQQILTLYHGEEDIQPRPVSISVTEMLAYLQLSVADTYGTLGVDHVMRMSTVIQVLISEKYSFKLLYPEIIPDRLETGPCSSAIAINDHCVVRTRGLPWQASDHDVAKFFKGLIIPRGGVALVLNPQGRRNGEALVIFESVEHRDLALLRHKHHMASRYIEVYRARAEEFLQVAAGSSREAVNFLSRDGDEVIRMRGLPFTATARDIIDFFGEDIPVCNGEDGILFVKHSDGRATGDAFVLFHNQEMAHASLGKHKQTMGKRYVEIFKSTAAEVQQVLSRHMTSPLISTIPSPMQVPAMCISAGQPRVQMATAAAVQVQPQPQTHGQASVVNSPGALRNCIRLRGMPYSATVEDIMKFLGELCYSILPNGIHMVLNQQGRPSGDAFIQMISPERAAHAAFDVGKGGCHKKHMGERYVEVFQCSGDEMNMVLMGGTLNRNGIQPPPGMAILATEQIQQPPPAPQIPTAYSLPPSQPLMFHPHPQLTLEMMHPQTILAAAGQRQLFQQPAFLPYAYLQSPTFPGSAGLHTLATSPGLHSPLGVAQQPHPGSAMGFHVRMQGVPVGGGIPDILTLVKGYNQHDVQSQFLTATSGTNSRIPMNEEKLHAINVVSGTDPTSQHANDWTCLA